MNDQYKLGTIYIIYRYKHAWYTCLASMHFKCILKYIWCIHSYSPNKFYYLNNTISSLFVFNYFYNLEQVQNKF